ncbi:MAG TPA: monooxygenase [Zeimonas sp.]
MISSSARRAVVIGASMAGLASAKTLARHFDEVVLIERDELPIVAAQRKGVPQGRHAHGLLSGGRGALERLFPDFAARAVAAGAEPGDFSRDVLIHAGGGFLRRFDSMQLPAMLVSRCTLEAVVRDLVRREPRVRFLERARVVAPRWSADGTRVVGVDWSYLALPDRVEALDAELVIDATGRGSRLPGWLAARGRRVPDESFVHSDVAYVTREFERHPGDLPDDARVLLRLAEPPEPRGGALLAIEGGRWVMTLFGLAGIRPEASASGFLEFAKTLAVPDFARVAQSARPLTDVVAYRIEGSRRRHYERLSMPDGILPIGDAICSFNPIFGQGMTVAALEALALDEELGRGKAGLARRYLKRASALVDAPWDVASGGDLRFPQIEGRRPAALAAINRYLARVHRVAQHDDAVALAFHRVLNLVDPPAAILRPRVLWRVMRPMRAAGDVRPALSA